jgi:hypothetical protein
MMFVRLRSQPDLLDLDFYLGPAGFPFFLGPFVKELTIVHHPAYGRFGVRGYFYQV